MRGGRLTLSSRARSCAEGATLRGLGGATLCGLGATSRGLLGLDVAAEVHQRLDGFGDERGRLARVGERVRTGADRRRARRSVREDLRLDDARLAVVDRTHDRDRAALLACVPDEQLAWAPA